MAPKLSLVTGTLDRPESLDRLVRSIRNNTLVDCEVIVGDASQTPVIPIFTNQFNPGRIRIIHESPRLGHIKGYNKLFRECTGEYVIWLNDDCEVNPGYDTTAIQFMESNPNLGLGAFYYSEPPTYQYHVNICFNMIFANFGILRRDFGDMIGWFDEGFGMYGGDNSITYKTLLHGLQVGTVPHKSIVHHSEKDALREANEKTWRKLDGARMNQVYGSREIRSQMQQVYNRGFQLIGPRILP